jgi:uncharacterized membrane protein YgdD (TMEM256/DUF423 family)
MTKTYLISAGISGFLGILMAWLGYAVMNSELTPQHYNAYNSALQFQMLNTIAFLAIIFISRYVHRAYIKTVYFLFLFAIAFYSGAIYLTSTVELTKAHFGFVKPLIPLGAILALTGWFVILWMGVTYVHRKHRHRADEK